MRSEPARERPRHGRGLYHIQNGRTATVASAVIIVAAGAVKSHLILGNSV